MRLQEFAPYGLGNEDFAIKAPEQFDSADLEE